jgi:hypothetical protein
MDLWSFAVALPIGILLGSASGIRYGRQLGMRRMRELVEDRMRALAQDHRITIERGDGTDVSYDDFMDAVLGRS